MKSLTEADMIADGWIKNDNGFPVHGKRDRIVEVILREEWEKENPKPVGVGSADYLRWDTKNHTPGDIIWWRYYHETPEAPVIKQPETVVPAQTTEKGINPKDAIGSAKVPYSVISGPVLTEIGLALAEGARKYGRHNYRVAPVRYSVYYDAAFRHLLAWWEGQDIDPDSGVAHISKAIAGLIVVRDAIINKTAVDDRPPNTFDIGKTLSDANDHMQTLVDKHPNPVAPYTR